MSGSRIGGIVALVAALHVAVLSLVFGPRHAGYMLTAMLSTTLIWGVAYVLSERRRGALLMAGIVVGLAVQQAAHQVWKVQLPGFWWPLAQFGALQFLLALGIRRTTKQGRRTANLHDR
jgi:hypothetical protein